MPEKLFIYRKFVLIIFCSLPVGLLSACGSSTDTTVIAVNQSNESNKKLTNNSTPPTNTNQNIDSTPTDLSKIPTISYCELIKNSAKYDRQIVRVRAIYFTAFERTFLYDETCETDKPPTAPEKIPAETWAQWDKSLITKGDSEEAKMNRQLNGFGRKDVTLIGKFNSTNEQGNSNEPNLFGHLNCCRFQFLILKLEKLNIDIKQS